MAGRAPAAGREPLTQERIVRQAVGVADERGVAALGMRGLAHGLGFEVMALYNHVANKRELLALMVDAVAAEVPSPPDGLAPLDAVRTVAGDVRAALLRHPWAAELWQQYLPGPARTDLMETLLRLLDDSGLEPELAHHGFHAVINHVMGYALQESAARVAPQGVAHDADAYLRGVPADRYPRMVAHVRRHLAGPQPSSFDLVLDLVLDGLVRLDRADG